MIKITIIILCIFILVWIFIEITPHPCPECTEDMQKINKFKYYCKTCKHCVLYRKG